MVAGVVDLKRNREKRDKGQVIVRLVITSFTRKRAVTGESSVVGVNFSSLATWQLGKGIEFFKVF